MKHVRGCISMFFLLCVTLKKLKSKFKVWDLFSLSIKRGSNFIAKFLLIYSIQLKKLHIIKKSKKLHNLKNNNLLLISF